MIDITKDYISMIAPNANAVKNGKSLADSKAFSKCGIDDSETILFASCKGSGTSIYHCLVDFSGETPVYQCTCPSRQIPCKHCVGLLTLKMTKNSEFLKKELPEYVLEYRKKRDEKESKKEAKKEKQTSKAKKTTLTSASKKKLEKQLEGLSLAQQFVQETMEKGITSLLVGNVNVYENLAKEMGNYYLTGVQSALWEVLHIVSQARDGQEKSQELVGAMVMLQQQITQCEMYLKKQIEENRAMPALEKPYELLGNVWKTEQLKELGAVKEKKELVQLSFKVKEDKVQKRFEDIGYYMVLDTKEIVKSLNLVPFKAVKHIGRDDSIMDVIEAENLIYYPGDKNPRIRMENVQFKQGEKSHWKSVLEGAISLGEALKIAKNQLKNPLADEEVVLAVTVEQLMEKEEKIVAVSEKDGIVLCGKKEERDTTTYLKKYEKVIYKNESYFLHKGVYVLQFWYEQNEKQIYATPLSFVTESGIIRF